MVHACIYEEYGKGIMDRRLRGWKFVYISWYVHRCFDQGEVLIAIPGMCSASFKECSYSNKTWIGSE